MQPKNGGNNTKILQINNKMSFAVGTGGAALTSEVAVPQITNGGVNFGTGSTRVGRIEMGPVHMRGNAFAGGGKVTQKIGVSLMPSFGLLLDLAVVPSVDNPGEF